MGRGYLDGGNHIRQRHALGDHGLGARRRHLAKLAVVVFGGGRHVDHLSVRTLLAPGRSDDHRRVSRVTLWRERGKFAAAGSRHLPSRPNQHDHPLLGAACGGKDPGCSVRSGQGAGGDGGLRIGLGLFHLGGFLGSGDHGSRAVRNGYDWIGGPSHRCLERSRGNGGGP